MPIHAPTTAVVQEMSGVTRVMREQKTILADGMDGAEALSWFCRHANGLRSHDVAMIDVSLKATHTPDIDKAQSYVTAAAGHMLDEIIQKAISMAQADFDRASELSRQGASPDEQK